MKAMTTFHVLAALGVIKPLSSSATSQHFMELGGSLLCSKDPATAAYPLILSQINIAHITKYYFPKVHFKIILPPTSELS
jgi:hypothetical protein